MRMELQELMDIVVGTWPFDAENYPLMNGLSPERRKEFVLRHILMHQAKALAKLTEVIEPLDHGAPLDDLKLCQATRNFLINTLRLADVVDMRARALARAIQEWAGEPHIP